MPSLNPTTRSWIRRSLALVGGAVGVAGLVYAALVLRPIDPAHPDTVSPGDLAAVLQAVPRQPLDAAHTDVLVVAVCTLRRDRMGMYGHDQPTTPFLDRLMSGGVVFEQHLSQAPWTRPAMGSIFTGRWPRVLKLDDPNQGRGFKAVVHEDHQLLAELLQPAGYTAIGAVANPNLKAQFGFAQGFADYSEPAGTYKEKPHIPSSDEVVDDLLEMAAGVPRDQRLYARVNVLDTHLPHKYGLAYPKLFEAPAERLRYYDAALRTIDAELARLYVELRKQRPNLLFVLVADHGEGLYLPQHHGPEHGNYVYRTTVETPWLVHHPSLASPERRISGRSMNIDMVPTVLDLLGLAVPESLDGESQAAAVRGETDQATHTFAYAETFFRKRHLSTIYDGQHQLIRTYSVPTEQGPFEDELFTAADWEANTDVFNAQPEAAVRLRDALTEWELAVLALGQEAPDPGVEAEVDASTDQMLRDLGYVDE